MSWKVFPEASPTVLAESDDPREAAERARDYELSGQRVVLVDPAEQEFRVSETGEFEAIDSDIPVPQEIQLSDWASGRSQRLPDA